MTETEDIIFQISDWDYYHEEDSGEGTSSQFVIRLYGTAKDGKKVYAKVDGFTPFFYVEIPKEWRNATVKLFIEELKRRVHPDQLASLKSYDIVDRHKFYGFTNYKFYNFVRLVFHSYDGFRAFSRALNRRIFNRQLSPKPVKYNQFESNLEPMLRFMHIRNIRASGWVSVPRGKYTAYTGKDAQSYNDINISTNWANINPFDDENISKFIVASYDIECTSEDGVSFPQPTKDGDKIIQIGTTFNYYGDPECYYKHIITLGTCDPIEGVEVESCSTEADVLLAWTRLIRKMNPDILTGYNIFGFDYSYIEARANKLGIHNKFTLLGRLKGVKSEYTTKDLSSSALGKNILYYYKMHGRVQIDLMKVVMRDHRLSSYKLDSVASEFIREQITKDTKLVDDKTTLIATKSTYGLTKDRYIKIFYNDGLSDTAYKDGKKFKVLSMTTNSITIDGVLDEEAMMFDKYKIFWCQAKDDVEAKDIFRLQKGSSADRAIIAKYCIQDCVLVNKLMEKLQILTNNIGMSNVCYVPLAYIFLRGQGIKVFSLVAKKCREKNHVIPVLHKKFKPNPDATQAQNAPKKQTVITIEDKLFGKHDEEEEENPEGYEGATVLKPQKGVHFSPIPVLDYASLYPSSMIHRNISHECLVQEKEYDNLPGYIYYSVTFYNNDGSSTTSRYAKKKDGTIGIIPEILQDLLTARKNTRKKQETEKDPFKFKILEGLQLAFKLTANSLYGQTGAPTSAIYLRDIAASTTATGREMLNAARLFAQHLFANIVKAALSGDYDEYDRLIRLLFNKKNDQILDPELIEKLKITHYKDNDDPEDNSHLSKPVDYYYLRVFQERFEPLTDKNFINEKMGHTGMNDFIKYFYEEARSALDGLDIDPFCVYGDSVTPDTPLLIRNNGHLEIRTIDDLNIIWKGYEQFKPDDQTKTDKQQNSDKLTYDVWTDSGWVKIRRVIRHKCKKKIYRIVTDTGIVDVTEDHSLLDKDGNIIKPSDCNVGTELLHKTLPVFNNPESKLGLDRAYIYGFFFANGNCTLGDTDQDMAWSIIHKNLDVLEDLKTKLRIIHHDVDFKIVNALDWPGEYALVPTKNIRYMINEYRGKFIYDQNDIIPNDILMASIQEKQAFLKAGRVASGQPDVDYGCIVFDQEAKMACMGMFLLLKSVGYHVSLDTGIDDSFELRYTVDDLEDNPIAIKKIIDKGYTDDFVYDLETESGRFNAGIGEITVKNTDSIFVDFGIKDKKTGTKLTDHHGLKTGIRLGVLCGNLINKVLPPPQNLTYEKTFWPWIILTKKRYVGNLYEFDPNKYFQKSMGIVLKRRDNAPIVKIVVGGIVKSILNDRSPKKAAEFTKATLKDILSGKYPLDKFIITKTLKGNSLTVEEQKKEALKPKEERFYADRSSIVHAVLADRMAERDPGNRPQSNDRIPYVYKIIKGKPKLQGDRVETPEYLIEHNEKIDYLFYITNQIMKPSVQFLEHVIESPTKMFEDHILREENRRKGLRPISSFFESNVESDEEDTNDDDYDNGIRAKFNPIYSDDLDEFDESPKLGGKKKLAIKKTNNISDSDEPIDEPVKQVKKKVVPKKTLKPEIKKTTKLGGFTLDL